MAANEIVRKELKRIAALNGGILKCEDIVRTAENKKSPLHPYFEWNDGIAAYEYRLEQARRLIRVTVDFYPGTNKEYEVFVSLSTDRQKGGGGYRELVAVISDENKRTILLADAMREMNHFIEKYHFLQELKEVINVMRVKVKDKKLVASKVKNARAAVSAPV